VDGSPVQKLWLADSNIIEYRKKLFKALEDAQKRYLERKVFYSLK